MVSIAFDVTLIATLFTIFFFVSPIEAGIKIYKAKDAGEFSATPCILAAACSLTQVYYCLVSLIRQHGANALWLNISVNAFGLIANEGLLIFHYVYSSKRVKVFLQNAVMLGVLGGFILALEFGLKNSSPAIQWWKQQPTYLNVCSIVAVVINIGMYAGPLAVMGTVIRTKSVQFMPLTPSVFVCCASTFWMTEGLMLGDVTFWLPNAIGLALGVFQLILYATYCRNKVTPDNARGVLIESEARQASCP